MPPTKRTRAQSCHQLELPLGMEGPPHEGYLPAGNPPSPRPRTRLLEDAIRAAMGEDVEVRFTDNRHVVLSQSLRRGQKQVRVHQLFLDAPEHVRAAVGRYLAEGDVQAGRVIDTFIAAQGHLLALHAAPLGKGAECGVAHDLGALFRELNETYFVGQIEADIAWGQTGTLRGHQRKSITLGSYCHRERRITIHPALDHAHIPRVCVARVVHHEMCHARHPPQTGPGGRRVVHSEEFRAAEAGFAQAAEADAWLDAHLQSLLRHRRATKRGMDKRPRSSTSRVRNSTNVERASPG